MNLPKLLEKARQRYWKAATTYRGINPKLMISDIGWVYGKYGLPPPKIHVAKNPIEFHTKICETRDKGKRLFPNVFWEIEDVGLRMVTKHLHREYSQDLYRMIEGIVRLKLNWTSYYQREMFGLLANDMRFLQYTTARMLGITQCNEVDRFLRLLYNGIYAMTLFEGAAFFCKIPIIRIENNLVSSTTQPAVEWEGFSIYFLDGVPMEKDTWQKILDGISWGEMHEISFGWGEMNMLGDLHGKARLIALRRMDPAVILKNGETTILDDRGSGTLYKVNRIIDPYCDESDSPLYIIRYTCPSTKKQYFKYVPRCRSVEEAQAWRLQLTVDQYKQVVES